MTLWCSKPIFFVIKSPSAQLALHLLWADHFQVQITCMMTSPLIFLIAIFLTFLFKESGLEAHQFYPLVQLGCSDDVQAFLCSLYTPVCMENYNKFLPPCRFLCERARDGCLPIMKEYGFKVTQKKNYSISL